jgi:hypothetical protein
MVVSPCVNCFLHQTQNDKDSAAQRGKSPVFAEALRLLKVVY